MTDKILEVRGLTKTYGGVKKKGAKQPTPTLDVLKGIDIDIYRGDVVCLIGPSGCGKSTFLRCLNRLEIPTSGSIKFEGVEVDDAHIDAVRQKMGMVFQHFNLFPHMTILRNMTLAPVKLLHKSQEEADAQALKLLQRVGLGDRGNAYPAQLSGGQRQRVAIARALASDPEVLLCDEATSALDPMTTQAILRLLQKINREMGITIVVITHEMAVIRQICTHVAILDGGVIAEEGSVDDVFTHTRSEAGKRLFGIVASENHEQVQEKPAIRIVFNGETIAEPIVADLILHLGVPLSIRSADVHTLNGAQYGQLLISRPDDPMVCHRAIEYLKERGLTVEEVRA